MLAPLLLVAGPFIVPAALVVVAKMVFATYLAQGSQVLELSTKTGGWAIELQEFFLISASLNKEKPRPL